MVCAWRHHCWVWWQAQQTQLLVHMVLTRAGLMKSHTYTPFHHDLKATTQLQTWRQDKDTFKVLRCVLSTVTPRPPGGQWRYASGPWEVICNELSFYIFVFRFGSNRICVFPINICVATPDLCLHHWVAANTILTGRRQIYPVCLYCIALWKICKFTNC